MEDKSKLLRENAKDELRKGKKIDTSLYETDLKVLVEELSIYQIELEHQNQELIQSQEQIQQSKDRYLDLFDNAPIGYLIVDLNGIIKDINQTACVLLENSKTEFVNNKITKIIHPDFQDIYYIYFRTLINQKHHQTCDIKLQKSNNTFFYARIQGIRQSHLLANEPEFRLAIIDVTIQKEMELKLLIAKEKAEEHDKLKSAFLANMSHEIRTPMNGIIGFADLLKNPDLSEESRSDYIEIIEKSSTRLLDLINELIDISKIESGQMQIKLTSTNVFDVFDDVISFLTLEAKSKNIVLELVNNKLTNPFFIETDKEKLYAVLLNLVKNSIKYTKQGRIKFGCYQAENMLKFYVRDTGIGIPEDKFNLVFQRFRQVEETGYHEGTGLGLSIVMGLIKLLGGKVGFASKVNKGSLFYFTLPYKIMPTDSSVISTDFKKIKLDLSNKRIIIAEDDYGSYYYLVELLKETHAEVQYAENGIQLLEMLETNIPDLILLDINMPLKNGYECLSEINKNKNNIRAKIIAITGYAMNEEKLYLYKLGCDGYISKPYIKYDLFKEIGRVMNGILLLK